MADGACVDGRTELWFAGGDAAAEAKAICARCPVIAECLAYALEQREDFGIWGGKDERERRAIRKAAARRARPGGRNRG